MSDKKITVEWAVDDSKVEAAVARMEGRAKRMQAAFNAAVDKIGPSEVKAGRAEGLGRKARAVASDAVREGERTENKRREREERSERKVEGWAQKARNDRTLKDNETPPNFAKFFGGGRQGGVRGFLQAGLGELGGLQKGGGGLLGGAIRGVGRAAISAIGGGGLIGTLASTLLGSAGLVGGIIASVVGAVMAGGQKQVEHTKGMLGYMRQEAITFRGRAGVNEMTGRALEYASYGFGREEGGRMSAGALKASKVQSLGDSKVLAGVLARGALNDVDEGVFGRYGGLSRRFGMNTSGVLGAERLAVLSKSMGLGASVVPEIVTGGYESLAKRAHNVDAPAFESLLGRAANRDEFRAGGERSVQGLMAIEGLAADSRDQIGAPFKELAGSLQTMRAYQEAAKTGKTGFGFISEAMNAADNMGADSTRDFWRSQGGDFATLMGQSVGGLDLGASSALMGELGDTEYGDRSGRLKRPGGEYANWDLFAWDDSKDLRQLGSPDALKEIVELNRTMKEFHQGMSGLAGDIAGAINGLGR